ALEVLHSFLTQPDRLALLDSLLNVSDHVCAAFLRFIQDGRVHGRFHYVVHLDAMVTGRFVLTYCGAALFGRGHHLRVQSDRGAVQNLTGDVLVWRQQLAVADTLPHSQGPGKSVHVANCRYALREIEQMLTAARELVYVHVGEAG